MLNLYLTALASYETYFTHLFQEAYQDYSFHWLWMNVNQVVKSVSIYRYVFYSLGFSKHRSVLFHAVCVAQCPEPRKCTINRC